MQCHHKKRDGKQYRAAALIGQARCAMHARPGRAAELGSKGGRRRAICSPGELREFETPKTTADLRELLAESIIEIRAGKLDPPSRECARLPRRELSAGSRGLRGRSAFGCS
jgi:hypothetical protein